MSLSWLEAPALDACQGGPSPPRNAGSQAVRTASGTPIRAGGGTYLLNSGVNSWLIARWDSHPVRPGSSESQSWVMTGDCIRSGPGVTGL